MDEECSYAAQGVFTPVLARAEQSFAVGIDHRVGGDAVGQHAGDIVECPHDLRERHGERDFASCLLLVAQECGFGDAVGIDVAVEVERLSFGSFHAKFFESCFVLKINDYLCSKSLLIKNLEHWGKGNLAIES